MSLSYKLSAFHYLEGRSVLVVRDGVSYVSYDECVYPCVLGLRWKVESLEFVVPSITGFAGHYSVTKVDFKGDRRLFLDRAYCLHLG